MASGKRENGAGEVKPRPHGRTESFREHDETCATRYPRGPGRGLGPCDCGAERENHEAVVALLRQELNRFRRSACPTCGGEGVLREAHDGTILGRCPDCDKKT